MSNVLSRKSGFILAIAVMLCCLLAAVPAYAFYYVHNEDVSSANDGMGTYEVFMVVDETAVGGSITSDLMFVPVGSTAEEALSEAITSSESQTGLENIHNYEVQSVAEYLEAEGYNYTIEVYETATSNSYDNYRDADAATGSDLYGYAPYGDGATVLNRYDNIYVTVTK